MSMDLNFKEMLAEDDSVVVELGIGGDDCSVSVWKLHLPNSINGPGISLDMTWVENQAQRGAVTGMEWIWSRESGWKELVTVSNDQVVAKWGWDQGNNGSRLKSWCFGGVRDVQGLIKLNNGHYEKIVVLYGDGISGICLP